MMSFHPKHLLGLALAALGTLTMNAAPLRVLYFTKSAGYEHSVVKRENGAPSYSERILTRLGGEHQIEFTYSKDGSKFSPEYLQQFDAIIFYTSGDLCSVGNDGQPAMTPAGKQALIDAVRGGKGFLALHSGSDTFHTGEHGGGNPKERANRYKLHGDASDSYVKLLGGEFINHNAQQVARATVVDRLFPGCREIGEALDLKEEWYSLKEFAPDLHALLVMETKGMEGVDYQRPPYPLAWARNYGRGRVWFNAMGHREDVWDNPKFQAMLVGGVEWAAGRVKAEVPPNLEQVAPQANTLPAFRPGT
jgi:type 1 glutamine amidotransferase